MAAAVGFEVLINSPSVQAEGQKTSSISPQQVQMSLTDEANEADAEGRSCPPTPTLVGRDQNLNWDVQKLSGD